MVVNFYNYGNVANCPNKIAKSTLVKSVDVSEIQQVRQDGLIALLGEFIAANYATYSIGGKTYVCSVEFLTTGNGTCQYTLNVDAVATAWENGVFDTWAVCERSNEGTVINDPELTLKDISERQSYTFNDGKGSNWYAIINVLTSDISIVYGTNYNTSNPVIETYILTFNNFKTFYNKFLTLPAADQQNYGSSILSLSFVESSTIPDDLIETLPGNTIKLYAFNREIYGEMQIDSSILAKPIYDSNGDLISKGTVLAKMYGNPKDFTLNIDLGTGVVIQHLRRTGDTTYRRQTINTDIEINYNTIHTAFSLYVRNVGIINFRASDIAVTHITNVGYDTVFDPVSGQIRAFLVVNSTRYSNIFVQSTVPVVSPFSYDNSVTNWTTIVGNAMLSVTQSLALSAITGFSPASLIGVGTSVTSGILSIAGAKVDERNGSYATTGSMGSSVDQSCGISSSLTVITVRTVNGGAYQQYFGKPDGLARKLSTLTGYVRTKNCNLYNKGLPRWIIDETKSTLDGEGVFISE